MNTKIKLVFTLLLLTSTGRLQASSNQWQQVAKRTQAQKTAGLSGGEGWQMVFGINYAPSNPNTAYFCVDTSQIWKSTDGGTSWSRKGGNFPAHGGASVVVDPTNENIVYVAGSVMGWWADLSGVVEGIIRTVDGGDTWTLVKQAHFHRNYARGHNIAFAGTNIYAAPHTGGILKSTNGSTWNLLNKNGGGYVLDTLNLYNIKAHPVDSTVLFVSATDGLYKITDSGSSATVTKIGAGLPAGAVYQLQIDRNTPNTMYIAAGRNGVYWSTDGGLNFSSRNNGLSFPISSGGSANFLVMSPANVNRLLVTFNGIFGRHLYHTNDGGANWTQTSNMDERNADGWVAGSIFGWTSNISGIDNANAPMAFHPTDQNIAIVSGWGGQIKKTTDGGVTWKYSSTGYTGALGGMVSGPSPIGWDADNSNRASFSHSDFGTLITTNGEDTFTSVMSASYAASVNKSATHSIAMKGNIIVETVGQYGPVSVFVSRNSGASWTDTGATHSSDMDFISFHPQNPSIVYAGKYRFDDIGTSNTYVNVTKKVNGIFKGNGDIVYAHDGNSTVYKSINKGASWTSPYPSLNLPSGYHIVQIAVDPRDQNRIYAAVKGKGIYIINNTTANGGTVVLRNHANGLALDQFSGNNMSSVAVDPNNANTVYAGATAGWVGQSNGVFRSVDKGLTWTNINGNLGSYFNVASLIVNPNNSYVYLNSFAGTWKLPPPGAVVATDTTQPAVAITLPTAASIYSTTASAITISGAASDNVGVTSVTWTNSANKASGAASGTSSWSIANIALLPGSNTITVTAKDAATNASTDTITVTYAAAGSLAPVITSALNAAGTTGSAFSYQIAAANTPTGFSAAGLPAGLSVSTGGLIGGTPTSIGTSSVTISAANSSGTTSSMLTVSVYSACDVNRDWSTNVVDVQLQVNAVLGAAACASDLNRDGVCNVIDVQRGVNAGLGKGCSLGP